MLKQTNEFIKSYLHIVGKSVGTKPMKLIVSAAVNNYEGHARYKNCPNILEINNRFSWDIINFKFQKTDI